MIIAEPSVQQFKERLSKYLRMMRIELVVNENRCTVLSVVERGWFSARLSVHRMFLDAPDEVLAAVAAFVKGRKRQRDSILRGFIQTNLRLYDYSEKIEANKLETQGRIYDLQAIYQKINAEYFQGRHSLKITWYGNRQRKGKNKCTFGQYHDHLKLIKIHRFLDDPFYPDYFVSFIVYHEMLHHEIPGYLDERGFFRTHGKEFKQREKLFADYAKAMAWEKANKESFFQ